MSVPAKSATPIIRALDVTLVLCPTDLAFEQRGSRSEDLVRSEASQSVGDAFLDLGIF